MFLLASFAFNRIVSRRFRQFKMNQEWKLITYLNILCSSTETLKQSHVAHLMETKMLTVETPRLCVGNGRASLWFKSNQDRDKFITNIPEINFGPNAKYEIPIAVYLCCIRNILMENRKMDDIEKFLREKKVNFDKLDKLQKFHVVLFSRSEREVRTLVDNGFDFNGEKFVVHVPRRYEPCSRCGQFGHVFLQCQSRFPRCRKCGEYKLTDFCQHLRLNNSNVKKYCCTCFSSDHNTGDKNCPRYPKPSAKLTIVIAHVRPDGCFENLSTKSIYSQSNYKESSDAKGSSDDSTVSEKSSESINTKIDVTSQQSNDDRNTVIFGFDASFIESQDWDSSSQSDENNAAESKSVTKETESNASSEKAPSQNNEHTKEESFKFKISDKSSSVPLQDVLTDFRLFVVDSVQTVRKCYIQRKKREISAEGMELYNKAKEAFYAVVASLMNDASASKNLNVKESSKNNKDLVCNIHDDNSRDDASKDGDKETGKRKRSNCTDKDDNAMTNSKKLCSENAGTQDRSVTATHNNDKCSPELAQKGKSIASGDLESSCQNTKNENETNSPKKREADNDISEKQKKSENLNVDTTNIHEQPGQTSDNQHVAQTVDVPKSSGETIKKTIKTEICSDEPFQNSTSAKTSQEVNTPTPNLPGLKFNDEVDFIIGKKLQAWTEFIAAFMLTLISEYIPNTTEHEHKARVNRICKTIVEQNFPTLRQDLLNTVEENLGN